MKTDEIRPKELFRRYLDLSRTDGDRLDRAQFTAVSCPACGSSDSAKKFEKNAFNYLVCRACNSLYCSPRPTDAQLTSLYEQSDSAKYWSEVFSPAVAEVRREKMFRKKAADLFTLLQNKRIAPRTVCDVGAGHGVFLEELQAKLTKAKMFAVEPNPKAAQVCESKGIETLVSIAQEAQSWSGRFDLVISSEVIEHVFSPNHFVQSLFNLAAPGGYVLMTGLGYEGFDILNLQEHSESVFPPHHLNFLSVKGFERLFTDVGFSDVQIMTPGILDLDIVLNNEACPEFVRVLATRGEEALREFQALLAKHRLSSHIWVLARK